ncbi:MAG: AarF/ABC1/UbiB kinase family protein [Solirubrobacterales bacterium]|nr:AarF/ABC1/UbiB kinase family protein [Solirubrobacterales bacterium]
MSGHPGGKGSSTSADERALALVDEFGSQLARMSAAGPKIVEFLAMTPLPGPPPAEREAIPLRRLRRVIEDELDARLGEAFADVEERPLAVASLGQVHRARTRDGVDVAIKVQHPGVAEAIERDLRNVGLVAPLLGRLAPGLDAGAVLAELRERLSEELDYEVEAQHHRRVERLLRGHPHVRVPHVMTDLSSRRMLVTEYVDGQRLDDVSRLDEAERDRVGEIAFRFFFGLARRRGIVAGDPAVENLVLCPDGRVCVLDFGLMRDLDADYLEGERDLMRAVAERDADALHAGLSALGYLPEPERFDRTALLEHLHTAGEWFLAPGVRRLDSEDVRRTLELGYPPRSPWFSQMRRQRLPPPTLLLRRMEAVVLATLGQLRAAADWGTISAEYWAGSSPSTPLGREEDAFLDGRGGA